MGKFILDRPRPRQSGCKNRDIRDFNGQIGGNNFIRKTLPAPAKSHATSILRLPHPASPCSLPTCPLAK